MKRFVVSVLIAAIALVAAPGCDSGPNAESDDPPTEQQADNDGEDSAVPERVDEETRQQALRDPSVISGEAPEDFRVQFETTAGDFTVEFHRQWAPQGVDRVYNLMRIGYYDDIAFFRVIDGFMAQFGIHGEPEVNEAWRNAEIPDDEVNESNTRGKVSFAMAGPNTRTTQLFVNYGDNSTLDAQGFSPVGEVVEGMDVVDSLHAGYGEGAPRGDGPSQQRLQEEGNGYLRENFEQLDWIETTSFVQ